MNFGDLPITEKKKLALLHWRRMCPHVYDGCTVGGMDATTPEGRNMIDVWMEWAITRLAVRFADVEGVTHFCSRLATPNVTDTFSNGARRLDESELHTLGYLMYRAEAHEVRRLEEERRELCDHPMAGSW